MPWAGKCVYDQEHRRAVMCGDEHSRPGPGPQPPTLQAPPPPTHTHLVLTWTMMGSWRLGGPAASTALLILSASCVTKHRAHRAGEV